ncbi:GntR family transcriptional regulator [Clostridium cochlearium]|uniref:GntR family transcriptional regulator n=1 Tax=Clostridium cochlearium TaxID=1494 RepID=A0A2X2W640_CLOCO|nr:GntR family transcriptional regulator [Clostridium cochlearium]SQB36746.1 GntR family transcriptional regulator [Clostridium cochlearium]
MLINKKTLSDQIYDILKMEILKRKIPFGTKLVNRALQKRFGVSSSPIRDAINRLNQDGLITSIDKTGATVVDFDYDFFLEVNEVLLYVVNTGIKLSFEKSDTEEICKHLEEYLLLQEKCIGTDEFYDYDYKFHKTFIEYSRNTRLKKIFKEYNVLHEMLVRSYYESETFQIQEDSIKMHKQIINAFRDKDYQLAMILTEEHYKGAEQIFKKILQQRKEELEEEDSCD